MKSKFLFALCMVILKLSTALCQSGNDTVYVYETVEIYDTVVVFDTVYRNIEIDKLASLSAPQFILQLDTLKNNANLLIISANQTATLPINSIILNENIKTYDDMKKISFLGLVLFAANSMLFAQNEYGLVAGHGFWGAYCNQPESNIEYTNTFNLGMFYKQNFKTNFFIATGIGYSKANKNNSYRIAWENEICHSLVFYDECVKSKIYPRPMTYMGETEEGHEYSSSMIGDPESRIEYSNINIPLKFGFRYKVTNTYVGVSYTYKKPTLHNINNLFYTREDNQNLEPEHYFKNSHHLGFNYGVDFNIFKGLSIGIDLFAALTNDFSYKAFSYNCGDMLHSGDIEIDHKREESLDTRDFIWKSRSITLNISYNLADLFKKKASINED